MDGWMTFWFYDVDTVLTIELTIPQLLLSFCVWIWLWSPSTLWIACWFWELLNIFFARACSALSLLFLFLFLPPFLAQKGTISSSCFIESNCDQWWRFVQVLRQRTCVHKYMLNTCNYIYIYMHNYVVSPICLRAFHVYTLVWYEYYIYLLRVAQWPFTLVYGIELKPATWFSSSKFWMAKWLLWWGLGWG